MAKQSKAAEYKINEKILARSVRLTGDNITPGIYTISEAMRLARSTGEDLVEISPNADPPVCRIIDYSKFLYQKKKVEKANKQDSKNKLKELRFGPNTSDNDIEFKAKNAIEFLLKGNSVRTYVQFKGRMIDHKERGQIVLLKFAQLIADHAKIEQMPELQGNKMFMMFKPKK